VRPAVQQVAERSSCARRLAHGAVDLGAAGVRRAGAAGRRCSRHRHVRVEGVGLEHHRHVALVRRQIGDVRPVEQARGRRLLEPGDHPQRRRLAAAGGAEQHHELAMRDREVERIHRRDGAVALGEALAAYGRHRP
jgi:hypothetical protein